MVDILGTLNISDQESEMPNGDYNHFHSVFISNSWQHYGYTSSCFYQLLCTHCHFLSLLLNYKRCLPEIYWLGIVSSRTAALVIINFWFLYNR
jgi:hypothetical protein